MTITKDEANEALEAAKYILETLPKKWKIEFIAEFNTLLLLLEKLANEAL